MIFLSIIRFFVCLLFEFYSVGDVSDGNFNVDYCDCWIINEFNLYNIVL